MNAEHWFYLSMLYVAVLFGIAGFELVATLLTAYAILFLKLYPNQSSVPTLHQSMRGKPEKG
ncbi:MAG: hypothetical protein HY376_03260 [Candidatus Blackburnbacteria bacterium]|nr:hypothetical protein [Candidatus Blackburnbacteria bacterium]